MQDRLREIRRKRRLTQQQLTQLCGIPQNTISEVETGDRIPNVVTAILLARALQSTVENILGAYI